MTDNELKHIEFHCNIVRAGLITLVKLTPNPEDRAKINEFLGWLESWSEPHTVPTHLLGGPITHITSDDPETMERIQRMAPLLAPKKAIG
jgi:hypothetical protein